MTSGLGVRRTDRREQQRCSLVYSFASAGDAFVKSLGKKNQPLTKAMVGSICSVWVLPGFTCRSRRRSPQRAESEGR